MEMKDVSGYNGGGDGYSFLLKTFYLWSQDAYLGLLNFIDNFTTTFAKREGEGYRGGGRGGGGGGYRNGDYGCYGEIGGGYESGRREGKDNGSWGEGGGGYSGGGRESGGGGQFLSN